MKTALLSVSDKTGIVEFAQHLSDSGIRLLSTGGTAAALRDAGLDVTEVSEHTGFPEIMGGRVKTLHPKIHGGILARRDVDAPVMQEQGIDAIDLVVVNLYPFAATIARPDCTYEDAIENIDIGGPAMIRAAAKNHRYVAIVTDPDDYARVVTEISAAVSAEVPAGSSAGLSAELLQQLAAKAFAHTAEYDAMVAGYLKQTSAKLETQQTAETPPSVTFPSDLQLSFTKRQEMRYGENPHQQAAFYVESEPRVATIASADLLQGKELSFNNISDADAALSCVKEFADSNCCVIVKHANPCGVATGASALQAYERAYACDPTSAFGGIIAFNRVVDETLAATILDRQFVEVLLAPGYSAAALETLASKPALRVLQPSQPLLVDSSLRYTSVSGGLLVQSADDQLISANGLKTVTRRQPTEAELTDLQFAWRVAKYVKSNAIVYAKDRQSIGIGAGQMSRVYSARIAAIKAADESLQIKGSVLASDAFFPFRDGIDSAAEVGVSAVIQPGGSRNDEEVIAAADEHDIAMVFTGMRHFRH